jgi:hypothetical protein
LRWAQPLDLSAATRATLRVASWLSSRGSTADIQVSADGVTWHTVSTPPVTDTWTWVEIDLSAFAGQILFVRFVFDGIGPPAGVMPDHWRIALPSRPFN